MKNKARSEAIVINGACGGIGSAIAKQLCQNEMPLVLLGRDSIKLNNLRKNLAQFTSKEIVSYKIDLMDPVTISEVISKAECDFGEIDTFINAAGAFLPGSLLDVKEKDWHTVLQTNLIGIISLVTGFAKAMIQQQSGNIILINGILSIQPSPDFIINSTVAAAVNNFAKAISRDLGKNGVKINVVNPGATDTSLWDTVVEQSSGKNGLTKDELVSQIINGIPLKRMAKPEEIAHVIEFLCSKKASYLNGSFITLDGGFSTSF